jgi:hypothetical protein
MVTIDDIDLADGIYTSAEIDISEKFLTIQCEYTGIDGDFYIIPMQSNETGVGANFDPIYDYKGKPIKFKVEHRGVAAGTKTFNITPEFLAVSAIIKVVPIGGQFAATEGTMTLLVKNTEEEAA